MRIELIRNLDDQQLAEELEKTRRELLNLRFRTATRQLPNTNELRNTKRKVAQILTIIRERQLLGRVS